MKSLNGINFKKNFSYELLKGQIGHMKKRSF